MNSCDLVLDKQEQSSNESIKWNRSDRVLTCAVILGVLNWFDLTMTLNAFQNGTLFEANPIAAFVLDAYGSGGLAFFKAILVGSALTAFYVGRKQPIAEIGSIATSLIYLAVACAWLCYPSEFL